MYVYNAESSALCTYKIILNYLIVNYSSDVFKPVVCWALLIAHFQPMKTDKVRREGSHMGNPDPTIISHRCHVIIFDKVNAKHHWGNITA